MIGSDDEIRFAAIGDCCVDCYVDSGARYLGGTAYNAAVQARRAGANVSLISAVGSDEFGQQFRAKLDALGISAERLRVVAGETSRVLIRLDESKSPQFSGWALGVLSGFALIADDERFLRAQHVARDILVTQISAQFEQFCSFDLPQTLKVADFAGGSEYSVEAEAIEQYAPRLDVVLRSVQQPGELDFLERISRDYRLIAVGTLGKAGSVAFDSGVRYEQPALAAEAVDTTGAGDAYIAHFIVNYVRTKNLPLAMLRATEAARRVVEVRGASDAAGLEPHP